MAKSKQDELIDELIAAMNGMRGKVVIPQVGELPPQMDCFYGTIMNQYCTTDLIRHYTDAIGDWRNPLWRNDEYARNTRWGGIIAPPTFLDAIIQPYAAMMPTDAEFMDVIGRYGLVQGLPNGSQRWLLKPVRPGDRF